MDIYYLFVEIPIGLFLIYSELMNFILRLNIKLKRECFQIFFSLEAKVDYLVIFGSF